MLKTWTKVFSFQAQDKSEISWGTIDRNDDSTGRCSFSALNVMGKHQYVCRNVVEEKS
jgi:hypothetical protein